MPPPPVICRLPNVKFCGPLSERMRAKLPSPVAPPLGPAIIVTVGEPVIVCEPLLVKISDPLLVPKEPPVMLIEPPEVKLMVWLSPR